MSDAQVQKCKELLKQLDIAQLDSTNSNKSDQILEQLHSLKFDQTDQRSYIPYPNIKDTNFYKTLLNKKEIQKYKYSKEDLKITSCDANKQQFQLTKNQKFISTFISNNTPYNGMLLYHGVGVGKCFARGTRIIMVDGSFKPVEDIVVGDVVMGPDSGPRIVKNLSRGMDKMYNIVETYSSKKLFCVNSAHILCIKDEKSNKMSCVPISKLLTAGSNKTFTGYRSGEVFWHHAIFGARKDEKEAADRKKLRKFLHFLKFVNPLNHMSYNVHWDEVEGFALGRSYFSTDQDGSVDGSVDVRKKSAESMNITKDNICQTSIGVRVSFIRGLFTEYATIDYENGRLLIQGDSTIKFVLGSLGLGVEELIDSNKFSVYGKRLLNYVKSINGHLPYAVVSKCAQTFEFKIEHDTVDFFYGFEVDGDHCFLVEDFIVTHNSCSSINVSEKLYDHFKKPAIVLMPTNLQDGFRKQIFDVGKGDNQCTGDRYTRYVKQDITNALLKLKALEKKINKKINQKYEMYGFLEFANKIKNMKTEFPTSYATKIKEVFSNRVFIIDEVHNIRDSMKSEEKIVPPLVLEVIKYSNNVKLLLLSATPMFNDASEIVPLLNMLLANDDRPLIDMKKVFDASKNLTEEGEDILRRAVKGYISYMRADNPYTFPKKKFPNSVHTKEPPTYDINGVKLLKKQVLKKNSPPLLYSFFKGHQETQTKILLEQGISLDDDDEDKDEELYEGDEVPKKKGSGMKESGSIIELRQISNIAFPGGTFAKSLTFNNGTYSYPKNIVQFLNIDHVANYSAKIHNIIESIKDCEGVVFVYSFFIKSGILPIALALEHAGMTRFDSGNLLDSKIKRNNIIQGQYAILSAQQTLTPNFDKIVDTIRSAENVHGTKIKIILGSSVSAEGLDLKNIRHLHIVEPWYHMNKMDQIVGRAVRNCSHALLPKKDWDVTIYYHTAAFQDDKKESIDERIYRQAQNKQINIDKVEKILKEEAVDCSLNKDLFDSNSGNHLCSYNNSDKSKQIDKSTASNANLTDDIERAITKIGAAMANSKRAAFTHKQLYDVVKIATGETIEPQVFMYALDKMLKLEIPLTPGTTDYLIYRSNKYILQPNGKTTLLAIADRVPLKPLQKAFVKLQDIESIKPTSSTSASKMDIEWFESLIEQTTTLLTSAGISITPKISKAVYDYVIDTLHADKHKLLSKYVLSQEFDANIIKSLEEANILFKCRKDEDDDGEEVWIFQDIFLQTFFAYQKDGSFKELSLSLKASYAIQDKIAKWSKAYNKIITNKSFKAYIKWDIKKEVLKFMVMDGKKPNSLGTVCKSTATIKLSDLKESTGVSVINDKEPTRANLCVIYEIQLREQKALQRTHFSIIWQQERKK